MNCALCQKVVKQMKEMCCKEGPGDTLFCDPGSTDCSQVFYARLKGMMVGPSGGDTKQFNWLWSDLTAFGSILQSISEDKSFEDTCKNYVSESFNCVSPRVPLPDSDVKVQSHREKLCAAQPDVAWVTTAFCEEGPYSLSGTSLVDIEDRRPSEDLEESPSDIAESADALGWAEVPVNWIEDRWMMADGTPLGSFLSERLHIGSWTRTIGCDGPCKELLKGTEHEMADLLRANMADGQPLATWLAQRMVTFLRQGDNWFVESIPATVAQGLEATYTNHGSMSANLAVGLLGIMDPSKLQKFSFGTMWAADMMHMSVQYYEDKTYTPGLIKKYLKAYQVPLADFFKCPAGDTPKPPYTDAFLNSDCFKNLVDTYQTYNAFFARKLDTSRRTKICYDSVKSRDRSDRTNAHNCESRLGLSASTPSLVSPADSRLMVIPSFTASSTKFWVKNTEFLLEQFIHFKTKEQYEYYNGGIMLIARLAPQDYHRFHFPVDGTVTHFENYPGNYYSVNPVAVMSKVPALQSNKRMHVTIDTGDNFGCVTYVSIGATAVGSVIHTSHVGQQVVRGMEHGFMAFGGSTVIVLVRRGVLDLREDLLVSSLIPVETLVQVGDVLGTRSNTVAEPEGVSPCQVPPPP